MIRPPARSTLCPYTTLCGSPSDESGQTLSFVIDSNSNATLFSAGPTVSSTGVLTYTPAANANGTATITLHLHDNGGPTNPRLDYTHTPTSYPILTSHHIAPS